MFRRDEFAGAARSDGMTQRTDEPWRRTMRKITAGLFISLDGVVEAPDQWHFPYFNDEMGAAVDATLGATDTILFGRKTYESFAGAWPEREAAGRASPKPSAMPESSWCRTSNWSSPGGTPHSSREISSR